jgi:hypothetical protein
VLSPAEPPIGTIILSTHSNAWQRKEEGWYLAGSYSKPAPWNGLAGLVREVIYTP